MQLNIVVLSALWQFIAGQIEEPIMFPNERTTLDDCHLRYFKLGRVFPSAPGFDARVVFKEYPHMAAIGWSEANGSVLWQCGGSLILDNFVLTAAHCVLDSRNRAPDVVRLGDLDLFSHEDDRYVQQLKIAEIVRHPEHKFASNYYDIALLKLEQNVTINYAVIPTCLWIDEEVRFPKLVAIGWGRTGFAMEQTPNLLKVTLKPILNRECAEFYPPDRKLSRGLQDHQMCAFDKEMDTCEGDSGGPLQVKLMHNSRMTPFVVGITSSGAACGTSSPGIYTKVGSYHDWIVETMRQMGAAVDESTYNETFCAIRYASYREFDEQVILHKTENSTGVDSERKRISPFGAPSQMVEIRRWNVKNTKCFGVIVDEDTVLTTADCAVLESSPPNYVQYLGDQIMNISKIVIHSDHVRGSSYSNLAILKMEQLLDLPSDFQPTCISHDALETSFTKVPVYGNGRRDINTFLDFFDNISIDPTELIHTVFSQVQHSNNCIVSERYLPRMKQGLAKEHVCVGNDVFLVPRSCDLLIGSPMDTFSWKHNNEYHQTMALSLFGRDCGFGEHVIGTSLASHVPWMESVLLPNYQDTRSTLQYVDPDLREGDSCSVIGGTVGRCVPLGACSSSWSDILSRGSVVFCSSSAVICCSVKKFAIGNDNHLRSDLLNCPAVVQSLPRKDSFGAMVSIGWRKNKQFKFECSGTIITKTSVLTTASCLADNEPEGVFLMGSSERYAIVSVLRHFAFNATDKSNDLALIKLNDSLTWSQEVFPACLWMNTTHTPIVLNIVAPWQPSSMVHPMYNSDCRKAPHAAFDEMPNTQICVRNPQSESFCTNKQDQLIWWHNETAYLIGLAMNSVEDRAPDVVRLGDLDLFTAEDDRYAQQFKIVEVIRHPEHKFAANYHDIALLRLDRNVTINYAVIPACLWIDEEIRFKQLVATGWGKTGFSTTQTPNLLKVSLKPVRNEDCSEYYPVRRNLRQGLQKDQHLCAFDEKMDTCEGDSGGPLQVKLLHNSKMTPFVVGITSFGVVCGTSNPGVYTKVSTYRNWIVSTMRERGAAVDEHTYNETFCAIRYAKFREFDDRIIMGKTENETYIDSTKVRIASVQALQQMVRIRWNSSGPDCYGVIVDEDTVLTVADCAEFRGSPPNFIEYLEEKKMNVLHVYIHPNHTLGSSYNNIAILKLEKLLDLPLEFQPSCIFHSPEIHFTVHVYGLGRKDINFFIGFNGPPAIDPTLLLHKAISTIQNKSTCIVSERYLPRMQNGLAAEHFCVGNEIFLVPGSCDLLVGSPLEAWFYKDNNIYHHVLVLNQFGRDCGFGEHVIGTRLSSHVHWMESVLLPKNNDTGSLLWYVDQDLNEGDSCAVMGGYEGRCTLMDACPVPWKELLKRGSVLFCSNSSVICCGDIASRNSSRIRSEILGCPAMIQSELRNFSSGAIVEIGWTSNEKIQYRCSGAIISKKTVVTSASCLVDDHPQVVQILNTIERFEIDSVLKHPSFNATDNTNDIALIKLSKSLSWDRNVFPICLWTNTTHTPIVLNMTNLNTQNELVNNVVHPMYNSDCARSHPYSVLDSQMCVRNPEEKMNCVTAASLLTWWNNQTLYLVGLAVKSEQCAQWMGYTMLTRISSYLDWISANGF